MSDHVVNFPKSWESFLSTDAEALGALVVIALAIYALSFLIHSRQKRPYRWRRPKYKERASGSHWAPTVVPNMADPQAQMAAVSKMRFERRRIMNKGEFEVFLFLEQTLAGLNAGYRLMSQTSLGELIRPSLRTGSEFDRKNAHASINSKRLDFAIIDQFGLLALAIEYQGSGHYYHRTFMRDAVKREALRRAGVELIEVPSKWDASVLAARVTTALNSRSPARNSETRISPA